MASELAAMNKIHSKIKTPFISNPLLYKSTKECHKTQSS
jgi:hypothetical protein